MNKEKIISWRIEAAKKKEEIKRFLDDLRESDPEEWAKLCRAESNLYHSYLMERAKSQTKGVV